MEVKVFTDGSLIRRDSPAGEILLCGYGIYFPNKEVPNVSRPFTRGRRTNQRAELFAIYVALLIIKKHVPYERITIYTDSQYAIHAVTVWVHDWKRNGWRTSQGKAVENQDIIRPIDRLLETQRERVTFIHIKAHTGAQDEISIGNNVADFLAKEGARRSPLKKIEPQKV